MVRPPQPTHRGGAGTLCVHVVSLCADTKTMTCRPCLDTYIHTYQQTDRQTDTQAYIHKSIQTYSYTYTWLHMCDVSPLWGGGVGGNQGGLDHVFQDRFWPGTNVVNPIFRYPRKRSQISFKRGPLFRTDKQVGWQRSPFTSVWSHWKTQCHLALGHAPCWDWESGLRAKPASKRLLLYIQENVWTCVVHVYYTVSLICRKARWCLAICKLRGTIRIQ